MTIVFTLNFSAFFAFVPIQTTQMQISSATFAARYGIEHLEACQKVQNKLRDTVIRCNGKIHHNLDDEKDVDATAEVVVHLLLFLVSSNAISHQIE